jgi:hypothetical protein
MFSKLEILSNTQAKLNGATFKLPKGYDAVNIINKLEVNKRVIMKDFLDMYETIKQTNKHKVDAKVFNTKLHELQALDRKNIEILGKLSSANNEVLTKMDNIDNAITTNIQKIHRIKHSQKPHHVNEADVKQVVELLHENITLTKDRNELYVSTYIVDEKGDSPHANGDVQKVKKVAKKVKDIKKVDAADINNIKERVKDLIRDKTLLFSNKQECISRAKAVFMSKDQIIAVIEKHEHLKKMMPSNFKKLGKEDLCSLLF